MAHTTATIETGTGPLDGDELRHIDTWWRAADDLSVGQIYPWETSCEPIVALHGKRRLLYHCGTTPGTNAVYAHLNVADIARDMEVVQVIGPDTAMRARWRAPGCRAPNSEVRAPISLEAVLPMLHLNGCKIANPTILERLPNDVDALLRGCWHTPRVASVDNPAEAHQVLAATLELCPGGIRDVPGAAHPGEITELASARARWATIVLRSPHGDRPERVTDSVPRLSVVSAHAHKLMEHKRHVREQGEDLPRMREWQWLSEEHPVMVTPRPRPKFSRVEGR